MASLHVMRSHGEVSGELAFAGLLLLACLLACLLARLARLAMGC